MIQATRAVLKHCGYDEFQFSGHSYRKGGATSLAEAGVAEWIIQLLGRWTSGAYKLYIATPVTSSCKLTVRCDGRPVGYFTFGVLLAAIL